MSKWFLAKMLTPKQESKRASKPGPVPAHQKAIAIAIKVKWEMNRGGELKWRRIRVIVSAIATEKTANP
jgi:hypothetical protein